METGTLGHYVTGSDEAPMKRMVDIDGKFTSYYVTYTYWTCDDITRYMQYSSMGCTKLQITQEIAKVFK